MKGADFFGGGMCSWDRDIMVTTSMSTRFITLKSITMRVSGFLLPPSLMSQLRSTDGTQSSLDTREEDLTHPEDIAHFRKHDQDEAAAMEQEKLDRMPIVEQNIPQKFRRY